MKQELTYEQLVLIERDIDAQANSSPAFAFLLRQRIISFYSDNKIALSVAKKTIKEMMDKHVRQDEKGEWLAVMVNDEFVKWDFYTDADETAYNIKYQDFMKRSVTVSC